MKKELKDLGLILLAVILIASGFLNLKNYTKEFSVLDISYSTTLEPLIWCIFIAFGVHIGTIYIKRRIRRS